jgi:hypothetical protein
VYYGPEAVLLSEDAQAAAAFQALEGTRARLELDLSAIGGANDTTIPIAKGKGGAAANDDEELDAGNDGEEEELIGSGSDQDGQRSAGDDSEGSDIARDPTNPLPDRLGESSESSDNSDNDGNSGNEGRREAAPGGVCCKHCREGREEDPSPGRAHEAGGG